MLQIITGKFFKSDDRHRSEQKAVFYSNYRHYSPMETCVGRLEPLNPRSTVTRYLFTYTNQIEKQKGNFSIVRIGDPEIIEQFRLLCSFGLRATFAEDRSWLTHLCRTGTVGQADTYTPSQLLPRYFVPVLDGSIEEANEFAALVKKILSLSRSDFLAVMSAIQAFNGALEVLGSSLDLAYSMLVYALESLSQKYIDHEPLWDDFDSRTRKRLDPILATLSPEAAGGIRAALLTDAHLKLKAEFQEFICSHVEDSFFTTEAAKRSSPLQHNDLRRAAKNIYDVRSAYVHELVPLIHQLRVPDIAKGDVFHWDNKPHLTFNGVVRLADHVIRTLIRRLPSLETEDFNWRDALPGQLRLNLSPQLWVHNALGFTAESAHLYLSGFLNHFIDTVLQGTPISDMTEVMIKIEQLGRQGKPEHRRSMLALYLLYNTCLRADLARPSWDTFLEQQLEIVDAPCIEMMAVRILLDGGFPWTASEGVAALDQYEQTRFHKGVFHLSLGIEIALTAAIANQALAEGLINQQKSLLRKALLNTAGRAEVQTALLAAIENSTAVPLDIILPIRLPKETPLAQQ